MKYYILYSSINDFDAALFTNYDSAIEYLYKRINNCVDDMTITSEQVYSTDDSKIIFIDYDYWVIIEPVILDDFLYY